MREKQKNNINLIAFFIISSGRKAGGEVCTLIVRNDNYSQFALTNDEKVRKFGIVKKSIDFSREVGYSHPTELFV